MKEDFNLNRKDLFQNESKFELEDFPKLKEFLENSEEKLNSYREFLKNATDTITKRKDKLKYDSIQYDQILKEEANLIQEIENNKNNILQKINSLESQKQNLNETRRELSEKIKQETEDYSNLLKESLERIENKYRNELEESKHLYQREIKSYHIDFSKVEREEVGKRELLRNLSDLTEIRKHYKEKEIEFLKNKLTREHQKLVQKYDKLKNLSNEHKSVSQEYQQIKLEEYNLLNIFFSFEKVTESHKEKKKELLEEKMNEYNNRLNDTVTNKINPYLKEKLLEYNYKEIVNSTDKLINQNELILSNDKKFISDYYKSKNTEILFIIKYLLFKQKETQLNDENKLNFYSDLIQKSIKELYNYSKVFEDDYTKNLIENSDLIDTKIPHKSEVLEAFEEIKKELFFDSFYYDLSQKQNEKNYLHNTTDIFKFLYCSLVSLRANFNLKLYDPQFNSISESDHDLIKRLKATSFIHSFIINENYSEAYHNLKYLTPISGEKIQILKDKLELMIKNELVIDLLESHFKH